MLSLNGRGLLTTLRENDLKNPSDRITVSPWF
jgi:hypothetical protein